MLCYNLQKESNISNNGFLIKQRFYEISLLDVFLRVATWSGKTKKNDKSQVKMGVFEKSRFLNINFFSSNLRNSLYFDTFNW